MVEDVAPAPPQPAPAPAEEPREIGFHNPLAVRIGLFLSLLTLLLAVLLKEFVLLWMIVAGVLAVYLYRRRTGEVVSLRGGVRLGWIMGLFLFVIMMIMVSLLALAVTDSSFVANMGAQMKARGAEGDVGQMIAALQSAGGLVQILTSSFVFCFALPMLGGLIGARLLRRSL